MKVVPFPWNPDEWMTTEEFAHASGYNIIHVRKLCRRGLLDCAKAEPARPQRNRTPHIWLVRRSVLENREWWTTKEAAEILGYERDTIAKRCRLGRMEGIKLDLGNGEGKRWLVRIPGTRKPKLPARRAHGKPYGWRTCEWCGRKLKRKSHYDKHMKRKHPRLVEGYDKPQSTEFMKHGSLSPAGMSMASGGDG